MIGRYVLLTILFFSILTVTRYIIYLVFLRMPIYFVLGLDRTWQGGWAVKLYKFSCLSLGINFDTRVHPRKRLSNTLLFW